MPRDIATRLRELYNAMNNPPSPGLPDGASVIIEAASAIDALKCAMIEAHEALDDHLGDSDFDHWIAREASAFMPGRDRAARAACQVVAFRIIIQ